LRSAPSASAASRRLVLALASFPLRAAVSFSSRVSAFVVVVRGTFTGAA
jgi:hypothetical protein